MEGESTMAFPLTEEQRQITEDRGGELLVSAAAGSGKTRVLVERLLDRVTNENLDIDRFLVITYTKAAAAELRGRIARELSARLAEEPGNRHLRRQAVLVYRAQISTIHAFCAHLLKENCHLLDLDPDFRLCEEDTARLLQMQTLEQVLDRKYEDLTDDSPFAKLVDTLASGRDDSRLSEIVLDIYTRIQSHPDPERWLQEQRKAWQTKGDFGQTDWGGLLLQDVHSEAEWCRDRMKKALVMARQDELLDTNYGSSIETTVRALDELCDARDWDETYAVLPIPFPAAGKKKKRTVPLDEGQETDADFLAGRMKAARNQCRGRLEKMGELMGGTSRELMEETALSAPTAAALLDLVDEFQHAYADEKKERSVLDFSDLEHMAVRLLLDKEGRPTELAEYCKDRFDEVLVDEYQDTNEVQNAIFSAVSDGGRHLVEVGDVKQSVYRFRLADPTIFLRKYGSFARGGDALPGQPRKRLLSRNFRSRPEILEGCNDLFRSIMSEELGELAYTEDQALVPGASFPEAEDRELELSVLDLSFIKEQEGEPENKDFLEARFAARRIRELLDQPMMVTDGDGLRPVRPSDITVLLRSPGTVLYHYIRAFGEENIPWSAEGGEDLFSTTEVNVALAILQIVDNPHQDVALIAALRSPVYGFTEDKLAILRSSARKGDFYSALEAAAERGDEQCADFLQRLEKLRFGAGDMTCRQLIWYIYEKTNILGIFGAMDAGAERQDNLLALYALSGQMEEAGCRTLFKFLLRLGQLRESKADISAPDRGRKGEGVSILSIHRAKGLESPVVLLCGLGRQFNRKDFARPVLFHPRLGIGPKGLDRERMVEYTTAARRAVACQLEREMLSEEMRLLYVAMTRAKDKLILTLGLTEGEKALKKLSEELSVPLSPGILKEQRSCGQWVLLHAMTRPEGAQLRNLAGACEQPASGLGPQWNIRWIRDSSLLQQREWCPQEQHLTEEAGENIKETLQWTYPYSACVDLPSKITATQMKGRPADIEAAEETVQPEKYASEPVYRPDFITENKGLTAAQKGTAIHLGVQHIPLDGDHTPEGIRAELDRMEQEGLLTQLQRKAIPAGHLSAFLMSPLGQEMKEAAVCRREFKFSLLVPAERYFPEAEGEQVLLQGVVDAWFEDENGITVLDFKSDHVLPGGESVLGEKYRPQLEAYSEALGRILGRPVRRRFLWFFATDTAVSL